MERATFELGEVFEEDGSEKGDVDRCFFGRTLQVDQH
jgi:hypothetical protein